MISLQLVLGSPVLGAQIKALEMGPVWHNAERDPDKTTHLRTRIACGITAQVDFNGAILKGGSRNYCQPASVIESIRAGIYNAYGRAPEVRYRLSFHVVELELVNGNRPWTFPHQPKWLVPGTQRERGQHPYTEET
jgi:hypothetical protein